MPPDPDALRWADGPATAASARAETAATTRAAAAGLIRAAGALWLGPAAFSVPRLGGTNETERALALELRQGTPLDDLWVHVELRFVGEPVAYPVGRWRVQDLSRSGDTVTVPVSFSDGRRCPVPEPDVPPWELTHTVEVRAGPDGEPLDRWTSPPLIALWPAPLAVERFGHPDVGGDGWCAAGTWLWLSDPAKRGQLALPAMGDVSGEHGRDIGHRSHREGRQIDFLAPQPLLDAGTALRQGGVAKKHLRALEQLVLSATGATGDAAKTKLAGYVASERAWLRAAAALPEVGELRYGFGRKLDGIEAGWIERLLKTGTVRRAGTEHRVLDADPTLPRLVFDSRPPPRRKDAPPGEPDYGHDDHIHVDLREPALRALWNRARREQRAGAG